MVSVKIFLFWRVEDYKDFKAGKGHKDDSQWSGRYGAGLATRMFMGRPAGAGLFGMGGVTMV